MGLKVSFSLPLLRCPTWSETKHEMKEGAPNSNDRSGYNYLERSLEQEREDYRTHTYEKDPRNVQCLVEPAQYLIFNHVTKAMLITGASSRRIEVLSKAIAYETLSTGN